MSKLKTYIRSLDVAALQFKLALQVSAATHMGATKFGPAPFPQPLGQFMYGGYELGEADLKLSPDDAARAAAALEHTATYVLAVAVDTALEHVVGNRFESESKDVVDASRIARNIRNAFTHNPFFPRWECNNSNHRGKFEIPGVITLDTSKLHGKKLNRRDYGGPLALLAFLNYCRRLLKDNAQSASK